MMSRETHQLGAKLLDIPTMVDPIITPDDLALITPLNVLGAVLASVGLLWLAGILPVLCLMAAASLIESFRTPANLTVRWGLAAIFIAIFWPVVLVLVTVDRHRAQRRAANALAASDVVIPRDVRRCRPSRGVGRRIPTREHPAP